MEGKLIKQEDGYYALYNTEGIFVSDVNGGSLANRLSLKNCQAIENGYDLDELAESEYPIFNLSRNITTTIHTLHQESFKLGFQKALELMGDKKYTETDLYKAFLINSAGNNTTLRNFFEQTVLPMIHHNEWDVEICCYIGNGDDESDSFKDPLVTNTGIPKLDNNGCLILKRK
jgi:hypothetical protein